MQRACLKASFITFHEALLKMRLASSSLMPSAKRLYSGMQKRIKFACKSKKQLKFESYLLKLPRTYTPCHPDRCPGQCTASASTGPTCVQHVVGCPR
jgi:hypothetical protein